MVTDAQDLSLMTWCLGCAGAFFGVLCTVFISDRISFEAHLGRFLKVTVLKAREYVNKTF